MSYTGPPNQPSWRPPGPYTGAQPPMQGTQYSQPYGAPQKNRIWMVPVAAAMGVVLLAATVWASASVVNNVFIGPQPESVLPASSSTFAKLDLKPSGSQLADYAQFVNALPDTMKDEIDPDDDPVKELVDEEFDYLDYDKDVEPWLGKRFGMATWQPDNDDAAAVSGGNTSVAALAVTDDEAAKDTLDQVKDEEGDFSYEVRDDFALIGPNSAALDDLDSQVEKEGTLEDDSTFSDDMSNVDNNSIAAAWVDLKALSKLESGSEDSYDSYDDEPFGGSAPVPENTKGRMAFGLAIEDDYLELRGDTFDVSIDGSSPADYKPSGTGLDELSELPDDTMLAVGGNGLGKMAKEVWKDNADTFDPSGNFESEMAELGASLPDGFSDLLGNKSAIGFTEIEGLFSGVPGASDPSYQFRTKGADSELLEELADSMGGTYGSGPGVQTKGKSTILSEGSTSSDKLGDNPLYKRTMQGMDDASVGLYMNLEQPMRDASAEDADQWGAVGASLAFEDSNTSLTARWAPNGKK